MFNVIALKSVDNYLHMPHMFLIFYDIDKENTITEATTPEVLPLAIVEPLKDFITREGKSARFTCKIAGSSKLNRIASFLF